jgi:hypothetical protein
LDRCPTKNIRWQAGDVRMAGTLVSDIFGGQNKHFVKSIKYLNNSYIEFQIEILFIMITSYFKDQNNKYYRDMFLKILPKTIFKNMEGFKNFLMSLFNEDKFDFKKFSSRLFGMMSQNNSAIYKQIKKQTYKNFNNIKLWENFYAYSLQDYISFTRVELLKNLLFNLDKYLTDQLLISPTDAIDMKLIASDITVALLDIYTIARIFKQPTGGNRSDLSFCYFGYAHINNIKRLLLSIGAYEVVISKGRKYINEDSNRCLDFTDTKLNLAEELKNHKLNK